MSNERPENVRRPRKLNQQEREQFLAQPHVGVLSVLGEDGRPPSALPTWYAYTPGGNLAVITRQGKRKSRLISQAGKFSLTVQRAQVPYRYVSVEGTVVKQQRANREELLRIGGRYLPADSLDGWAEWELGGGNSAGEPEYIEIRPDRWLTGDFSG